jgi:hypothetical protein
VPPRTIRRPARIGAIFSRNPRHMTIKRPFEKYVTDDHDLLHCISRGKENKIALAIVEYHFNIQKLCTFEIVLICGWWRIDTQVFSSQYSVLSQKQAIRQAFLLKADC